MYYVINRIKHEKEPTICGFFFMHDPIEHNSIMPMIDLPFTPKGVYRCGKSTAWHLHVGKYKPSKASTGWKGR